jgi:DeoR/GlpR family transcriptional regulator of sugar metabolism
VIGVVPETREDGMRPRERRPRIVDLVTARGSVRIEDLARELGVSIMTIHRDLDELGEAQVLRKVRGAATVLPSALFESRAPIRLARQQREKEAIARAALEHVEPGQAIMLDDSTTGIYFARLLPSLAPVTVITNFLAVMRELGGKPEIRLIGLGGAYFEWADAFMGSMTIDAIKSLRADVVVMSTSAITEGVCYHQSQDTVMFKKAMLEAAASRILYVDHTKFIRRALHALAPLTSFDLVIVDDQTPHDTLEQLRSTGVPLEVVPMTSPRSHDGRGPDLNGDRVLPPSEDETAP